jgi:hypothetical protein
MAKSTVWDLRNATSADGVDVSLLLNDIRCCCQRDQNRCPALQHLNVIIEMIQEHYQKLVSRLDSELREAGRMGYVSSPVPVFRFLSSASEAWSFVCHSLCHFESCCTQSAPMQIVIIVFLVTYTWIIFLDSHHVLLVFPVTPLCHGCQHG